MLPFLGPNAGVPLFPSVKLSGSMRALDQGVGYPAITWPTAAKKLGVWLDAEPLEGADALSVFETALGATSQLVGYNLDDSSLANFTSDISYAMGKTASVTQPIVWAVPLATGTGDGTAGNVSLAQAVAGSLDTVWQALFAGIKANRYNRGDIFRPGWEMNGNWFGWYAAGKASTYIAAFQRFVTMARAAFGAHGTAFSWCPSLDGTTANPESFYPGDTYVDFIDWDQYYDGTAWSGDGAGFWLYASSTAAYNLSNLDAFAAAHSKRRGFAEYAVNDNTGGVTVINSMAAYIAAHDIAYHCYYFETSGYNGRFDQYPAVQAAYVAAFGPPTISTGNSKIATAGGTLGLASNQAVTWSISGADAAVFSLAGSTLTCPANTEGTVKNINLIATDVYGYQTTKAITVTSHDVVPITGAFIAALTPKTVAASSFTWASEGIGAAAATRFIIVTLNYRAASTPTLTSVTIGGVTATIVKHHVNTSDTNTSGSIIACALVPTGTTGDIVATFSANVARIGGGKYRALNLGSATPDDTDGQSTAADGDPTLTIDTYANGLVIGTEYYCKSAATAEQRSASASKITTSALANSTIVITNTAADAAWTGTAGVVEDYDQQLTTASFAQQAAAAASWAPV